MKVILDKDLYNNIWDEVNEKFKFNPSTNINQTPFELKGNYKVYKLKSIWTKEQEKIVNNIFKEIATENIYALDWEHDCFEYNPAEEIPLNYNYHDANRNCEVYFPSYYPNGDYHFFIAKDFSYGMLGDPWRKEIYVFNDNLINSFESKIEKLELLNN